MYILCILLFSGLQPAVGYLRTCSMLFRDIFASLESSSRLQVLPGLSGAHPHTLATTVHTDMITYTLLFSLRYPTPTYTSTPEFSSCQLLACGV